MNRHKRILLILSVLFLVGILTVNIIVAKPNPRALKACSDGIDNDGDGYTDYPSDPGCSSKNDKSELDSSVECDDGIDNDGDGDIDSDDEGCSGPTDNDETDCGDDVCEGGETSGTCPEDCGYPDSCSDTDGGILTSIFGTTSGYLNDNPYSNDDYCVDSSNIMEYYCSGDYSYNTSVSCGTDGYTTGDYCTDDLIYKDYTDYFCLSGECDSDTTPELQEDCDDSDGYGSDYCSGDIVKRDYNNYFCSGGACDYTATPEIVEDCDSYDYYGSNYCYNASLVYRDYYDYYCSDGSCNYSITPSVVEECYWGCTDGECDPIPDSCSDTDGGWVILTQGTVSGYLNEQYYSDPDYCVTNTTLMEYYCSGNYAYNSSTSCFTNTTSQCINGARV